MFCEVSSNQRWQFKVPYTKNGVLKWFYVLMGKSTIVELPPPPTFLLVGGYEHDIK
jgi:hypothetical protein